MAVLGNLPALAAALHWAGLARLASANERTSAAIFATRRAVRAGRPTTLIAANSLARDLEPLLVSTDMPCLKAGITGLHLFSVTTFARMLTEYAPSRVLVVPLAWPGFYRSPHVAELPAAGTGWVPHPLDEQYTRWHGFGRTSGLPRQLRLLARNVAPALGAAEPWVPPEVDAARRQAYYAQIRALTCGLTAPPPDSAQRLAALRAYGAARGTTVLYYLSPHSPRYFDQEIADRDEFTAFRAALAPDLLVDLGDLLSQDHFTGDMVHFDEMGSLQVSVALANALAAHTKPTLPTTPAAPTLAWRLRAAAADLGGEATTALAAGATPLATAVAHDARTESARVWAELRLRAAQYPRYVRTILGREAAPGPSPARRP